MTDTSFSDTDGDSRARCAGNTYLCLGINLGAEEGRLFAMLACFGEPMDNAAAVCRYKPLVSKQLRHCRPVSWVKLHDLEYDDDDLS